MLSLSNIISTMSAKERERFKERIAAARQIEIELQGIRTRSLKAASDMNDSYTRIFDSLQTMTRTLAQVKGKLECSRHAAEEALSAVRSRRERDLQAYLAHLPDSMFVRV
jgi:hypothetical protein